MSCRTPRRMAVFRGEVHDRIANARKRLARRRLPRGTYAQGTQSGESLRPELVGDVQIDAAGQVHQAYEGEPRIVSLVPSVTELVCMLGLTQYLVGRTGFCIHPKDE